MKPVVTNSPSSAPAWHCPAEHVVFVVNIGGSCVHGPRSDGAESSSSRPPAAQGSARVVSLQPSELHARYHLPSLSCHGRGGSYGRCL
jgi:hypothetical protein